MHCPSCGHENRPGRKFCGECGNALPLPCAACGTPNEPGEKFCGECGAALAGAPPRAAAPAPPVARPAPDADVRKVVTIVFADLVGSTALHERLDPESVRRLMDRYYGALRTAVEGEGGTVVKLLGDGVMAAFGLKRVAEDDALRAVRAAAAMQDAFRALVATNGAALGAAGLRVAVNTGEVVVTGAQDDVIGDPVNVAARLQEQGTNGDVVLGEATRRLVATRVTLAPLGSVALKGRAEAVAAHRLVSLEPPAGATAAPFVGREDELARLEAVYEAAVAGPATRLAVLVGSPGLGKSRLIGEVGRRHGEDATILTAHCDAAGGATFAPLAQALRRFLGLADGAAGEPVRTAVAAVLPSDGDAGERARIAGGIDALLGGSAMSPEETFFVVRRFLAGLAATKPAVLVIDDLHWAEPLLLDLVEHLVQWGSGVPLFVLVGARPELHELRSSMVTAGGVVAEAVVLGGLDAGAAMRLAAGVIGAADLPAAVAAKVLATSEGNPLFVGELVRMLVQEGALTKDGERWTAGANLAAFEMPPTIHALLAARIERLGAEDRVVLERAAVVGRHFSRSAVAALLGANGGELDARLESLRRSELIERDTGWLLGEPALRFHHVLIRDAAYRRLLKGTRAELHERLAGWIEGQVGDAAEHDETIGWHLEQAHQLLRELGPLDAAGDALGERAARRLAAAGRRALARDDVSLAAGLLGRAHARLAVDAPERADLVLDWCEALLAAGDVGPAADAIVELDRLADSVPTSPAGAVPAGPEPSPRLRAWHTCFAGQLTVLTAPEALHATADQVGAAARDLAALGDAAGEAKAHFVHAQALGRLGKIGASEAALDQALAAARRAGDRRRANAVLAGAPLAALWGPSPVTRASGRCLDVVRVLRITQGAPAVEAVALSCQGVLEALRGRTEAARRMLASSRTMVEELGISHRLYETDVFAGRIDLLEGEAPAAERALRAGYDGLRELGLGIDAARAAALLGRALLAQDRAAEAETLSHESELLAGDDLQAAIAWRGVRAEALARRGDHAAAIQFAEAAVAIAAATDAFLDHADARLALAAAFRAGGRQAEADAEERRAFELWEAKGATVLAEHARRTRPPVATREAVPRGSAAFSRSTARRVRANAASVLAARFEATFTAGDADALAALWDDELEVVDHANGAAYGRDGHLASIRRLWRARDPRIRFEALATLGASLCLARRRIASAGTTGGRFDVGASEYDALVLTEVDERGAGRRIEIFSTDHLGDAIARLYERYADQMPEGPSREHAAVAARAVAYVLTTADVPELSLIYAATYEDVDHRTVGYGHVSGEALGKLDQSLQALADGLRFRIDDVLALEPRGFVRTTTSSGTWREGGGAFERTVCTLTILGPDGRITNHETFDADREVEALARFDALARSEQPKEVEQRPVRPNAVTRAAAEFERIVAARDFAALETFFAEDAECIDHPHGATYGAEGMRAGMRRLMQAPDARLRFVPLATLGDSWGLVRREMSASGAVGGRFDVGAYEIVDVAVYGTDARGRLRHVEIVTAERLGAAIVRLYECHAESLSDGPASARTRASGRALAVFDGPIEFGRIANAYSPSFEAVDQRILGTWSAHGREEWLIQWREQFGLADESGGRYDEVLALEPAAILVHQTFFGISRESGGDFEHVLLVLYVFGADGRIARVELFEPERAAAALARFDALTADAASQPSGGRRGGSPRFLRANAATAAAARFDAAFAARDEAGLAALCADDVTVIDHPTGADYGRDGVLESYRRLLQMDGPTMCYEPLATLGDSLALFRRRIRASGGRLDVGEYERVEIVVAETDDAGRFQHHETFAAERLRPAIVRLYERYAASLPEGPAHIQASGVARALLAHAAPLDPDRIASNVAPSFVGVDHRVLGTWSAEGREQWRRHFQEQAEIVAGFSPRDDDVLAANSGAHVLRTTFGGVGRASGGAIENLIISVITHDAEGLITRIELFEPDQEAEALACFERLTTDAAPQPRERRRARPNAATRTFAAMEAAFGRRDLDAVDALLGDPLETIEHPTGTTYGREGQLESSRWMMRLPDLVFRVEPLATLGESLCLARRFVAASGNTAGSRFEVGAYEIESIVVNGVDAAGRLTSAEVFAPDRLGPAIGRLHTRYAESLPAGPERMRAEGMARTYAVWEGVIDPERVLATTAPSFVCVDHRSLGTWSAVGPDEWGQHWRTQAELAEGFSRRDDDLLAFAPGVHVLRHTFLGTNRATDGPFENVVVAVHAFDADGRHVRMESWEPDQESAALARFDELVAGDEPTTPARRRVRANAATRSVARFDAILTARDRDALVDVFAESLSFTHHPTGVTYGRREMVGTWRSIMKADRLGFRSEVLASVGDTLVLERHQLSLEGLRESHVAGFGLAEFDEAVVIEVDDAGRWCHAELFEAERLGDAVARLYARHAERLPEGSARARALMTARAVATMLTRSTEHRLEDVSTPDIVAVDHRAVGMGTVSGPDLWTRWRAASDELMEQQSFRVEDVLALGPEALLRRTTETGNVRASGGAFENGIWILSAFGPDGRQSRIELFDVGRETEALARFDALVGPPGAPTAPMPSAHPFANAATRSLDRFAHATDARDWDGLTDVVAPSLCFDDRRPLFQMQLGKEGFLEQHRVLFDVPNAHWIMTPIATRGERLTLSRILLQGEVTGGGGALEIDHRGVIEVDADGRMTAIVLFEPADLDAAYAELDARFAAGEGARHPPITSQFSRAIARRDWEAVAAMCGPGFAEHDHRSLALLGISRDPETWVRNFRVQVELAPDTVARFEHVRPCPRGNLWTLTWEGSRDGGRYEIPMVGVTELDGQGKLARVDLYDPEQLDQARARFVELAVATPALPAEPFANAASATVSPVMDAILAHDWEGFAQCLADDFRMSDCRRVVQLELDREQYITFTRSVADGRSIRARSELLATRGERLALVRSIYEFSDADVGPSEIAFLLLTEVDARGRIVAYVRWDVEDLAAAYAEIDRRWQSSERVAHPRVVAFQVAFSRTLASRDWDGIAALLAPGLVAHDHPFVGWDVLHGPAAYVDVLRGMVDLAADANGRLDHARAVAQGFLAEVVWVGTRDGGAFESPFVWVVELDAAGLAQRLDFYDPHRLEMARARFAEIERKAQPAAVGAARDPLSMLAKPNLATAWWDRWFAAYGVGFDTGNWDAVRGLVAPGYVFDDRQRLALVRGDVELFIASARERAAIGARPAATLVGTAGERVAIERILWSGGPSDGRFEIEYLAVIEVDETGRLAALVFYDLDDARAAQRDAWARWAAIEPHVAPAVAVTAAAVDAFAARDRARMRANFTDDVVVEDHRRSGIGRIEGVDDYVAAVAVLWELASDHHLEIGRFWVAVERHGFVATLNRFGTLPDGGAFESPGLWLCVVTGGRIARAELFEVEDVARARARLAELRPDPLRIPPNAATRWRDQWYACGAARDLEGLERLYAPTATFDDRRRLLRVSGDRTMAIESARHIHESGRIRFERTLLATAGDRLALERCGFYGGKPGADFAIEVLSITEVDANGLALAIVNFDVDDRAAADEELFERYAASGADGTAPAALDAIRAWNAHDLERFRALLPAEFYLDDHRRTGVGRLEGRDAYVDSLDALWGLSRDIRLETLYTIAVVPHCRLWICRWFGSNAEGGEFDAVYVCVGFHDADRGCLEIFELDDLDAARARFAALAQR